MARQRNYYESGKTRELEGRAIALQALEDAFVARQDEVLECLASDLGKPEAEAFLAEYYFVLQEMRLVRKKLRKWLKNERVSSPIYSQPCRSSIHYEPRGSVLIFAPWNYPIQLSLAPLVAAVAAGNTVILKPSEAAPASARLLHELVSSVFPSEHVSVLQGDAEVAKELLEERFDFILYTGSTAIGKKVAAAAAEHLTPVVLELGGKCPCVVHETADLEKTAERILIGKLFNAGQTCFAPDFVIAHQSVHQALVNELQRLLQELPWEEEIGRIISKKHFERLQKMTSNECFQKGEDLPEELHYAPRLDASATWDSPAMQEEIFGPLLPVLSYESEEELLENLGELTTPLALYCFARDDDFVANLLQTIPSGGVTINDTQKHAINFKLPFGGQGESGHGRYRGKFGVRAFSVERSVAKRYFLPDPFALKPPREKMARFFRKWMK